MSAVPYIALYPGDFLADVGHLGNSELGVYWRLLLVYYRDGRPLPTDLYRLRRIAMTFSTEECRALDSILEEFFSPSTNPDGSRCWRHKRADSELERANRFLAAKRGGAEKARQKLAEKRAKSLISAQASAQASTLISDQASALVSGGESEPESDISPLPPKGGRLPEGFEAFWTAYPRKVGKDAALRAWRTKVRAAETRDAVMDALAVQKESDQWTKENGRFIPNPATWLNQGRWKDESFAGTAAETSTSPFGALEVL